MIKALCTTWDDKEVKTVEKERIFNNVKLSIKRKRPQSHLLNLKLEHY